MPKGGGVHGTARGPDMVDPPCRKLTPESVFDQMTGCLDCWPLLNAVSQQHGYGAALEGSGARELR